MFYVLVLLNAINGTCNNINISKRYGCSIWLLFRFKVSSTLSWSPASRWWARRSWVPSKTLFFFVGFLVSFTNFSLLHRPHHGTKIDCSKHHVKHSLRWINDFTGIYGDFFILYTCYFAGFIDFIVEPSFQVMGDMIEKITAPAKTGNGAQAGKVDKATSMSSFDSRSSTPRSPRTPNSPGSLSNSLVLTRFILMHFICLYISINRCWCDTKHTTNSSGSLNKSRDSLH